ncbi:Putative diguanylate cyclase (GGDEF) with GAF and HAMP domains [Methylophaga frappieri]|uniref:diguanylate cyclase n=1 Tax=Methylophaga frappieri (strain ATCC BAA-2434 / DSM 25690 / JAM7) TaxID=754477 RepID=I1YEI1_METFJ|nr:GGDEF domain-containing protein [Methylophaga frappieri]AFJ01324.1 Putative diguanylate cyclase (GGDEF) with GAF and HAMP domains [Methylophaga frappieri]
MWLPCLIWAGSEGRLKAGLCCLGWLCLLTSTLSWAAPPERQVLSQQPWYYQWGDVSAASVHTDNQNWQSLTFPANPPDRNGEAFLWLKTTLPTHHFQEPVIYITSVDLTIAAYLDGQKIYQFGEVTADSAPQFIGWPWHEIPLPPDAAGKTLTLKIFSDYTEIGLWGDIWLTERSDLHLHLIRDGFDELLIAGFLLLLGITALIFAFMRRENGGFFYLGCFALVTAGNLLGESQLLQLIASAPLLKVYLAAMCYFLTPVFIAMLLSHWCQRSDQWAFRTLALIHVLFLSIALGLSLSGLVNLSIFYPAFDLLFIVTCILMTGLALHHYRQYKFEQRMVMLAFFIYAAFLFADMLIAHGFTPWVDFPLALGALLFALIVSMVSLSHFKQLQTALERMNNDLESHVMARTAELQGYVDREMERSQQLLRINEFSLRLEQLIGKMQQCNEVQTATRLVCEGIHEVFKPWVFRAQPVGTLSRSERPQGRHHRIVVIDDLQGHKVPHLIISNDERLTQDQESAQVISGFMNRVTERLGITLSSIRLRENLQKMSFEDALTGLKNRRYLDDALPREYQLAQRYQQPLSVMMCDIDFFKNFNDTFGHEAGDMALRSVATQMLEHFRETDIPCRYGGEEFVVLMPGASAQAAYNRARDLLLKIAARKISYQGRDLAALTLSIGIACWRGVGDLPEDLLLQADKTLYRAKMAGRNCIEMAVFPPSESDH